MEDDEDLILKFNMIKNELKPINKEECDYFTRSNSSTARYADTEGWIKCGVVRNMVTWWDHTYIFPCKLQD